MHNLYRRKIRLIHFKSKLKYLCLLILLYPIPFSHSEILIDQKDSAGTLINFFGKDVKTQTGFLKIARKYNLKIIPMKNIRLPDNTLEITFEHPLDHNEDSISDNAKMLEINSIVERWIRENPENWFWQHKRFN